MRILALLLILCTCAFSEDIGLGTAPASSSTSADTLKVHGITLGTTAATAGTALIGTGTTIASVALSGGATIDGAGVVTLGPIAASGITSGQLAAARGGTALDCSAAGNGKLLIGNGTGFSLANLTAGTGMTVTNASGAITLTPKTYQIASDCSAHAVSSGTSETILKTHSITAASIPVAANSLIRIHALWTYTNSANAKTVRVRIGAAGAGTGGTIVFSAAPTTTATIARDVYLFVRSTSSQVCTPLSAATHETAASVAAAVTPAIDLTANWEIAITGTTASSGETITLEASAVTIETP